MKFYKMSQEDIKNLLIELAAKGFIALDTRFFDLPFGDVVNDSLDAYEIAEKPKKVTETVVHTYTKAKKKK